MYRAMQGKQDDPRWSKRCRDKTDLIISNATGDVICDPLPAGRGGDMPTAALTFQTIRQQYVDTGKLWEDNEFPADDSSLYVDPKNKPTTSPSAIEWKRPKVILHLKFNLYSKEIMPNPQFIMDGISRFDVKQTKGDNCWFLASIASLAMRTDLIEKIVPKDQGFSNNYCGVFRFNFWLEGKWREVMVDDRLPTANNRLVYVSCGNPSEFWAALLEKAYAK
ncbi:calpain 2, (m II) large subunit [Cichlidogyrus casuarinus]|uniref:Calpain 2, (M II) large subunit n=1 Tax=Cichlidogyrus casuarinus TaxID=1844966 RepID=A0ABD2QMZ2_9PLAT